MGGNKTMNLLEHYIEPDYKVEPCIPSPIKGVNFVKVTGKVNCYGNIQEITNIWSVNEWEKIKKQGYYMA